MALGGKNINDEIGDRNISHAFLPAYFLNLSPGEKTFTMYSLNGHRKFIWNVEPEASKNVSGFTFIACLFCYHFIFQIATC